ncbi:hypothetical protein B0H17DRAFT_1197498 [Mycena rosella]|uniref:Uncharacterized protein n=1 Tax=Mycena rosella TaxID=1033263 RepID=A0AAD7DQN6_MYCRO|nr:hypothetical protein B0H17DRAFT_1197498 [Mycena rosella]
MKGSQASSSSPGPVAHTARHRPRPPVCHLSVPASAFHRCAFTHLHALGCPDPARPGSSWAMPFVTPSILSAPTVASPPPRTPRLSAPSTPPSAYPPHRRPPRPMLTPLHAHLPQAALRRPVPLRPNPPTHPVFNGLPRLPTNSSSASKTPSISCKEHTTWTAAFVARDF